MEVTTQPQTLGKSNFYLPFAKVDAEQQLVYGWASTPTKDLQNEIVTLDAIKNALPEYLPWGNIREMHQPSAVGVCKQADMIEGGADQTGLYICAKIVDPAAWLKVKEGVYKGFSIGGEKLKKIGDTVTELKLYEISIVDRPANPECRVDYFKAVGLGNGAVDVAEVPMFDRREVGLLARLLFKATGGKKMGKADIPNPEDWGRDGFSAPAPTAVVDHGNPANVGAVGPSEPLPHILTQPGGAPVPSSEAYLADVPPRDQNRILLMAGKAHVFRRDGSHLASFPADEAGKKAAAAALKAHIAEDDAQKMVGNAASKAKKIAKRDRKMLVKALEQAPNGEVEKAILDTLRAKGLIKAEKSTAEINDLPDSDFAYIENGGKKDDEGKTTPRSLRHLPIHDASHVRNAAARLNQTDIPAAAKAKAHRKIKARGKEFGVEISDPGEKTLEPVTLSKEVADTVARLRAIQAEIVQEGMEEGGDPKDLEQAQELGEVIEDLREHVLGEAQSIESLFPDDDGSLFAN